MVTQTPIRHKSNEQQPEPIRVIKWIGGRYVTVELTPEQVEATRKREMYVQEFNPNCIEGW